MNKQKDKTYVFRANSAELSKIKTLAKRAKLTVTDYLINCALGKEIMIIDGLEQLLPELKAQGKNLNQLTMLAHMGKPSSPRIDDIIQAYSDICAQIKRLTREVI